MFSRNAHEFIKILFRTVINLEDAHSYKDNITISLRKRQLLFTFLAFLKLRINSYFRLMQQQMSAVFLITSHLLQWNFFRQDKMVGWLVSWLVG